MICVYREYGKRLLDVAFSGLALAALSPVAASVAIGVRVKLGSPVVFRQRRPGLGGKPFEMYKFRTMTDARDAAGDLLPDEARLTDFGRWLRSTSLDELPELVNVLRGDMSIVGPRPLLVEYLPLYTSYQRRRHEVRPGLTGLAQVRGRNTLTWEGKFESDVEYVDSLSFRLDAQIVAKTIAQVLRRVGISQEGEATMSVFRGSTEAQA
jgi:lipopolysaccharide/colanic/teichoic acid biosynthesis glycosyltransferase